MVAAAASAGPAAPAVTGSSRISDPVRTVRLLRRLERLDDGPAGPGEDRHVGPAAQRQHRSRVLDHLIERDIAGHAGDGDELDLRRRAGQEQGERVVDPRVDIEDHRQGIGHVGNATGSGRRPTSGTARRNDRTIAKGPSDTLHFRP